MVTKSKKRRTKKASASAGKGRTLPSRRSLPSRDHFIDVVGILLTIAGLLTGLAMLPSAHSSVIAPWLELLAQLFGLMAWTAPVAMIMLGLWLVSHRFVEGSPVPWYRILGLALYGLALIAFLGVLQSWRAPATVSGFGGLVGLYAARLLVAAVGTEGALVTLAVLAVLGLLFFLDLSFAELARALRPMWRSGLSDPAAAPALIEPIPARAVQLPFPATTVLREHARALWERLFGGDSVVGYATATLSPAPQRAATSVVASEGAHTTWELPPWRELLEESVDGGSGVEDIRAKTQIIEETLSHFGIPARVVEVNRGPTVTQYGIEPGFLRRRVRGVERDVKVKVSAITSLQNDLALALAAQRIRIEAPVPGQGYVGIEVPNDRPNAVTLHGVMASDEFQQLPSRLRVALGCDVRGNSLVADIARMPHLLIAGATGSGKSVCINTIIGSLLCHNTPDQLKLLMVDPKMVELVGYNGIPHLIVPVVTDVERVVGMLRWTVSEMERRYKLFSAQRVRNLEAYNARALKQGEKPLPHLVLIIDELADLMMAAADQVEGMICRLAQMARATGIHLILATQRPSVDVVTGLIKANFPARIAFAVTSQVDSRVILDRPGAETLLGRGDMLYIGSDSSVPKRLQGCFVSDRELDRINLFWREQAEARERPGAVASAPQRTEAAVEPVQPVLWDDLLDDGEEEEDELMPDAREIVRKAGTASVSMLQRRLRVGYARAARLVDLLEAEGTIGASEGPGKTRNVYSEESEDEEELSSEQVTG